MTTEMTGQMYYSIGDFYTPDWWDEWQGKNLRKKIKTLSKRLKQ